MLRPPGRDRGVRKQERKVGQISPAPISPRLIGPPFAGKAQQQLDDVAVADVGSGRHALARRRGQRDFGKERERHGQDRDIGLEHSAVVTARGDPVAALVNRRHGGVEMDRGSASAAFGCEMLDQRAIALGDPPVQTVVPGHPFVAQGEGAGTARVGRVVALDRPRDRPPQLIVLPFGKMRFEEFGNRQIGFHRHQGPVKPIHMTRRRLVGQ